MSIHSSSHYPRPTNVLTQTRLHVGHRVAIAFVAVGIGFLSLALGVAFINSPSSLLVVAPAAPEIAKISSATAVTLTWQSPARTELPGPAVKYEFRVADFPITAENFAAASIIRTVPPPHPAGYTESFTVTNLKPATTYFFAYRLRDTDGHASEISKVITATTAPASTACVPNYTCTAWTACLEGFQTRNCSITNNCQGGLGQPLTEQICTLARPVQNTTVAVRNGIVVAGTGPAVRPTVRILRSTTLELEREITVLNQTGWHGAHAAAGDIDGDGQADVVVGSGPGADAVIEYYSIEGQRIATFRPYPASERDGVDLTVDDLDADGIDEIITVPARGAAQLRVFHYQPANQTFIPMTQTLVTAQTNVNGSRLTSGDLDLDGRAEIIVLPRTHGNSFSVWSLNRQRQLELRSYQTPFADRFLAGLTGTVADIDGDGQGEVVTTAGPGSSSDIKVIAMDGTLKADFWGAPASHRQGLELAAMDINADGREEILAAPYTAADPRLTTWSFSILDRRFHRLRTSDVFSRIHPIGLRLDATPRI